MISGLHSNLNLQCRLQTFTYIRLNIRENVMEVLEKILLEICWNLLNWIFVDNLHW